MAPAAWAKDTDGSIRIPAALCGIAGLRPSSVAILQAACCRFPQPWHCRHHGAQRSDLALLMSFSPEVMASSSRWA